MHRESGHPIRIGLAVANINSLSGFLFHEHPLSKITQLIVHISSTSGYGRVKNPVRCFLGVQRRGRLASGACRTFGSRSLMFNIYSPRPPFSLSTTRKNRWVLPVLPVSNVTLVVFCHITGNGNEFCQGYIIRSAGVDALLRWLKTSEGSQRRVVWFQQHA